MATKAKESSIVGKEKKAPSSNSHTTTTKRTTKPSTTTITTNSTNKPDSTPYEKNIPNYLKPGKTSLPESPTSKQPKSNSPNNKTSMAIRGRSWDKPFSSLNLTRSLTTPRTSSIGPANKSTIPSIPISDRTSKAPSDGKTKPLVTKGTKKTIPTNTTTSTSTKKVANKDHASVKSTKGTPKETKKTLKVETEQVKEVTKVEVIKVENEEHKGQKVEHVNVHVFPNVEYEHEIEHVQGLENYDHPPHYQVDDERVISIVPEAEKESLEEKAKDKEHELEEDKTNQDKGGNNNESDHQENHEGKFVVNDEGEGEGCEIIIEDHKSENKNSEEAAIKEQKEAVDKVEENKVEATPLKQQLGERRHGKMEAQVSNDEIEKTVKLLEERKNKVRALAGAFQIVIDHQTTSK
ncbi:hypothetical protein JHK82_048201 [Glycine max]|nr:hypothetical protein JHK82_048201 [Glycine max]KAH1119228.1 hypothetical protein GYH30_047858 [Glycine max]